MNCELAIVGAVFMLPVFVVFFIQCLLIRVWRGKSAQLLTLLSMAAGYPLFFALLFLLPFRRAGTPLFYTYVFMIYSFWAYIYFHVFNMSETSRRMRMLTAIASRKARSLPEVEAIYDDREMIQARLLRLVALGQVREERGRYFANGIFLTVTADLLYRLSSLLGKPWLPVQRYLETRQQTFQ